MKLPLTLTVALAFIALASYFPPVLAQKESTATKETASKPTQIRDRRPMTSAERAAEDKRLREYDKPIQKDQIGNALIGGAVSGVLKGSAAVAAQATAKGSVTGTAVQQAKEHSNAKKDAGARVTRDSSSKGTGPIERPGKN